MADMMKYSDFSGGQQDLMDWLTTRSKYAFKGLPTRASRPPDEFMPGGLNELQQQGMMGAGQLGNQMAYNPNDFAYDPQALNAAMAPVGEYAQNMFQNQTIPGIANAFSQFQGGDSQARSGGNNTGLMGIAAREGRNLSQGLAAQFAPMAYQGQQDAYNRQFAGQQGAMGRGMQIPGMQAALGAQQYGIEDAQRQYGIGQWQTQTPEANPYLNYIQQALGQPKYGTAFPQQVDNGFPWGEVGQMAGGIGLMAMGGI